VAQSRRHKTREASASGPTSGQPIAATGEAAVEFLDLMKGTLPELITTPDLETLNTGLRFFFSELRLSSALFQQSGRGGRAARTRPKQRKQSLMIFAPVSARGRHGR
jgi:hypothetical protein